MLNHFQTTNEKKRISPLPEVKYYEVMGIKNLYKVLQEECPDQIVKIHISKLSGCNLAIDISIFLYKYIRSMGEVQWMNAFIHFLCILKRNRIKAICVFDGPNPPIEKQKEQEERRAQLAVYTNRLQESKRLRNLLLKEYCPTARVPPKNIQKECSLLINPRHTKGDRTNYNDAGDVVQSLVLIIERIERQVIPITTEHKEMAKKIVKMMGLACFEADGEAETLCAYLAYKGDVSAVLTEDTDVLAYGCPLMLSFKKLRIEDGHVYALCHKSILDALELTIDEFRDLCILLRCDYNRHEKDSHGKKSIMGFPPDGKKRKKPTALGYKSVFKMVQEWRNLEEVTKHIINPEVLKYERCRELFTLPNEIPEMDIPFNKPLELENIKELLTTHNLYISLDYIKDCWKPPQVIFDSGSSDSSDSEEPEN